MRRRVALKVPHPERLAHPEVALKYLEEARTLALLDHPGIVPIYDIGRTSDGHCFLVRANETRRVRCQGEELSLAEVHRRLQTSGVFRRSREVTYRGQQAVQRVAEATVVLDRPAWRHRRRGQRVCNERVPGEPIR